MIINIFLYTAFNYSTTQEFYNLLRFTERLYHCKNIIASHYSRTRKALITLVCSYVSMNQYDILVLGVMHYISSMLLLLSTMKSISYLKPREFDAEISAALVKRLNILYNILRFSS